MSERLSELSASVSTEIQSRMQDSRDRLQASQKIITGMRKEPVIVNGMRAVLEQIEKKLEEVDDLHVSAMQKVNETYGAPRPVDSGESE